MKWDILILTMPSRKVYLKNLVKILDPQVNGRDVSYLIRMCDPNYTLGENRDMLMRASDGHYVSFVDDDDGLPDDFVSTILPLLDGVDYVGFNLQCYIDGKPLDKVTRHSLQYKGWYEDETGYYRDISHVNPMRRSLALLEPFEGGHGEDQRWADRMRARDVLRTEHYLDCVMYRYYFRTRKNMGRPCPKCGSDSTVLLETETWCNGCANQFDPVPRRRSCLWA
jgi:glycosyl transferase family 2